MTLMLWGLIVQPSCFTVKHYSGLAFSALYGPIILLYTASYCFILLHTALYCFILLYTALYCFILLHTALYCFILLCQGCMVHIQRLMLPQLTHNLYTFTLKNTITNISNWHFTWSLGSCTVNTRIVSATNSVPSLQ